MPQTPKVSMLMATYNSAATLEKCLASIEGQSWGNVELIIMDGGSKDGTQDILSRHSSRIAYWESKPDKGVYHAWNKAFDHFTGDWFGFIGSDDAFTHPKVLENAMAVASSRQEVRLITGLINQVDGQGNITRVIGRRWDWATMKRYHSVPHPGMLQHRTLFETHGRFSEEYRIAADYEYMLRFGPDIPNAFIPEPLVDMGNQGLSRKQIKKVFRETLQIQSRHPEIGAGLARYNFVLAYAKNRVRDLLQRQY